MSRHPYRDHSAPEEPRDTAPGPNPFADVLDHCTCAHCQPITRWRLWSAGVVSVDEARQHVGLPPLRIHHT